MDPWVGKIPLVKGMATHSSFLAWRIPRTEYRGAWQATVLSNAKSQIQLSFLLFRVDGKTDEGTPGSLITNPSSPEFRFEFITQLLPSLCILPSPEEHVLWA